MHFFHRKKNKNKSKRPEETESRPSFMSGSKITDDAATNNQTKRTSWLHWLFGRRKRPGHVQDSGTNATAGCQKSDKRSGYLSRFFVGSSKAKVDNQPPANVGDVKAPANKGSGSQNEGIRETERITPPSPPSPVYEEVYHTVFQNSRKSDVLYGLLGGHRQWLGLPNSAQNCYMISSLQSLITLKDFIRDIRHMEELWSSVPEAEVIRRLMNIVNAHRSPDVHYKLTALELFKHTVSAEATEFCDNMQKDAHEFLTTVLYQIRNLSPLLEQVAASRGRRYTCPVEEHLLFKMQTVRTCRSCGNQTKQAENFTHLSLDLVPRGSIEDMLDMHLMETELNYKCDCGNHKSCQQSSFMSLPRVLMLQVKRFFYTPFLTVRKLHSRIQLFNQLLVTSSQACGLYTLVSVISHLGDTANRGHYLSEGVNPDADVDGSDDCWFTYDDSDVTLTTRDCVCQLRDETAYILFYRREL